ncbi:MAG: hypothetical protein KKH94_05575 [Candidatus Omnitrophica bacterium]|nr:hypothetical protein [Candidatus Omnitrophota bacterium]
MKHLGKYIVGLCIVTIGMLFYVHQQITVLRYSYTINNKEERLATLIDTHKNLTFQLASLKSPATVEQKLRAADINLVIPHEIRIVKVPVADIEPIQMVKANSTPQGSNVLRALGFGREAQAELSE